MLNLLEAHGKLIFCKPSCTLHQTLCFLHFFTSYLFIVWTASSTQFYFIIGFILMNVLTTWLKLSKGGPLSPSLQNAGYIALYGPTDEPLWGTGWHLLSLQKLQARFSSTSQFEVKAWNFKHSNQADKNSHKIDRLNYVSRNCAPLSSVGYQSKLLICISIWSQMEITCRWHQSPSFQQHFYTIQCKISVQLRWFLACRKVSLGIWDQRISPVAHFSVSISI